MIEHEPWGAAKVNVKHRGFSWDEDTPIAGETPERDYTELMHGIMGNAAAVLVTLLGWKLMEWWWNGGWWYMRVLIGKYCGWLLQMIDFGAW